MTQDLFKLAQKPHSLIHTVMMAVCSLGCKTSGMCGTSGTVYMDFAGVSDSQICFGAYSGMLRLFIVCSL